VTPQLPTRPAGGYTIAVHIAVQKPDSFLRVRPIMGGPKPSLVAISPFRVAVLREVKFGAQLESLNQLRVAFDVLPGRFPARSEQAQLRYEPLWTVSEMSEKEDQAKAMASEALSFSKTFTRMTVAKPLLECTKTLYGDAGMPLHPAEAVFISKALVYVLEDGLDLEPGFSRTEGAWFKRLCQLMAEDRSLIDDIDTLIDRLYTAVLQDAVLVGFKMVSHDTRADFGDGLEQADYALRLVSLLESGSGVGLEHIYVPLVMAGTMLHGRLVLPNEKQWHNLDELKEARNGRISLADAAFGEVFNLLNTLIERAERLLKETRVPRK
jgi:hypothetical protein